MSFYIIPSFINLVIKAWLFWYGRQTLLRTNRALGILLISFFLFNLAELISFLMMGHFQYYDVVGRAYYVTAIFGATMMLIYADTLSIRYINWKLPIILAICLSLFVIFSNTIIAGVSSLGYILTRVPGPYYWIVLVYGLGCTISALILLFTGLHQEDLQRRRFCGVIFLGFLPIVLTAIIVVLMMAVGIRINAAILLTSAITLFLVITIYTEIYKPVIGLLTITPVIGARVAVSLYQMIMHFYRTRKLDMRIIMKNIEEVFIYSAFEASEGKRQNAADMLSIPLSTFNEKLRKITPPNPTNNHRI